MLMQTMAASAAKQHKSHFWSVMKANHFNILAPVTKLIAEKILKDEGPTTNITIEQDGPVRLNPAQ